MVKKKSRAVKKASLLAAGGGGPVKLCEIVVDKELVGDYYFLVKVVPINDPPVVQTEFSGTIHLVDGPATHVAVGATRQYALIVNDTPKQSKRAVRFEINDMNQYLDTPGAVDCAIDSIEGKGWLKNAIDYAVCKVTIK